MHSERIIRTVWCVPRGLLGAGGSVGVLPSGEV